MLKELNEKRSFSNHHSQRSTLTAKSKMKDIMLQNFIKKHLPHLLNPNSQTEIREKMRLTQLLQGEVDHFMDPANNPGARSIKELEVRLLRCLEKGHTSNPFPAIRKVETPSKDYENRHSLMKLMHK